MKGSDWGCDQEVARIFADSAPIVMREMAHWGVPWNRVVAGKHTYYKGGKPFEAEEEESKHGLIHARAFGGVAVYGKIYRLIFLQERHEIFSLLINCIMGEKSAQPPICMQKIAFNKQKCD